MSIVDLISHIGGLTLIIFLWVFIINNMKERRKNKNKIEELERKLDYELYRKKIEESIIGFINHLNENHQTSCVTGEGDSVIVHFNSIEYFPVKGLQEAKDLYDEHLKSYKNNIQQ